MASDSPSSQAASTYLSAHTNEMVELQHLNGRLTSYIERLHFLEQQNQTLAAEVKRLRGRKLTRFERLMDQTPQKEDVESRLAASGGDMSESLYLQPLLHRQLHQRVDIM